MRACVQVPVDGDDELDQAHQRERERTIVSARSSTALIARTRTAMGVSGVMAAASAGS